MKKAFEHIEENKMCKKQIKPFRSKRFFKKIVKYLFISSKLFYVLPIIVILFIFRNNRLIGAIISIASFYVICKALNFYENSPIKIFVNKYLDSTCDSNGYEHEFKIKND